MKNFIKEESRTPTTGELAQWHATRKDWDERWNKNQPGVLEQAVPFIVAGIVGLIASQIESDWGLFLMVAAVVYGVIALNAKLFSKAQMPDNPFEKEITEVVERTFSASRVVFAIDECGDGMLWMLFEVAPNMWLIRSDDDFPFYDEIVSHVAFESVTVVYVDSCALRLDTSGAAIPVHGAIHGFTEKGIDRSIADGFCFSPWNWDESNGAWDDKDAFSSDELPEWVSNWDVSPERIPESDDRRLLSD